MSQLGHRGLVWLERPLRLPQVPQMAHAASPFLALLTGLVAALPIAGCGGVARPSASDRHAAVRSDTAVRSHTAARPPSVCTVAARAAVVGFLKVDASAVASRAGVANSGAPQCAFTVRLAPRRELSLWVSADSSPQPYAVLERAAEEEAQMFTTTRTTPAPQHVGHLGLDAYWFPEENHLLTTDAVRLITATVVKWPGAPKRRWRALAAAAARPYLRRSQPKLARGPSP
jgi:hypothetical protein